MKIAAVLADGFEDIEAVTVIDILRRVEIEVEIWGLSNLQIISGHNLVILADKVLDHPDNQNVDGLFLPGGKRGVENLIKSTSLLNLITNLHDQQKWLVAICAAPYVLEKAKVLNSKRVTIYPSWAEKLKSVKEIVNQPVVIDDHIVTSQGVGTALDLGLTLCKLWAGDDQADKLASAILYNQR